MASSSFLEAGFIEEKVPIPASAEDPLLKDHWIYALRYEYKGGDGKKEPLLLLHGHPQNHLIYHRLGPALSKSAKRDLVITDLRGHGKSGVPKVRNLQTEEEEKGEMPSEEALRARYSKRQMGRDMKYVMKEHFGYDRFAVVGHDRGGRVAHRMALDDQDEGGLITRVMVLDIVPTLDLYNQTNSTFASVYFHWFFLIQPYPFPEKMIASYPRGYLDKMVTRFNQANASTNGKEKVFPDDILDSYLKQLSSPDHIHATCEDYRCSAPGGYDLTLDQQDRNNDKKVKIPLRALWGARGLNQVMFPDQGSLSLWKNVCQEDKATGKAYDCGHYMPEELPNEMEREILDFFT